MTEAEQNPEPRPRRRFKRWILIAALPILGGIALLPKAMAWGHHGHHKAKSAEELREHMDRRADWVLGRLDASDAQRTQIDAILDETAPKAFALMKEGRELRKGMRTALLAPEVDEQAVQAARADLDALADQGSELFFDTITRVSKVLTPEQRAQIDEHLARFRHH